MQRASPPDTEQKGSSQAFFLSKDHKDALKDLAKRQDTSLFTLLLAAYQLLIHRLTGQHDIAIGTVLSDRNMPEVQRTLGNFLNTLIIRTDLAQAHNFSALLKQVQSCVSQALAHAALPFDEMIKRIKRKNTKLEPIQAAFVLSLIHI